MHDDWTQRLAVLGLETAKLEKHFGASDAPLSIVSAIRDQLVSLSLDVHDLSRQLHPSILDDLGLSEALRSECTSFSRRENIAVDYRPDRVPEDLSTEVALCLYRVAQEALRNVAKHASVKEMSLGISTEARELVMLINDQGAGFDMEATRSEPSVGLSSMEERIRLVQGKLSIRSAPGQGTTVEVRVPMTKGNTL